MGNCWEFTGNPRSLLGVLGVHWESTGNRGRVETTVRMAHPSKNVLKHVENNTNGFTQDLVFPLENGICPGCAKGKMHNKPFPPSEKRALKPFDLIHADLIELPIRSYHKKKWVCMLMDDYSSYAYCFLLRSKDETYTAVKQFLELIKLYTWTLMKTPSH